MATWFDFFLTGFFSPTSHLIMISLMAAGRDKITKIIPCNSLFNIFSLSEGASFLKYGN